MAVNESIITGRKWRRLIDKATGLWQRISYWTHSSDVEFNDGKNAETKVGAIDGITDSLASTSSRVAASAKAVSTLNNNLSGVSFHPQPDGLYAEYMVGADTVLKKLGNEAYVLPLQFSVNWPSGTVSSSYTLDVKGTCDVSKVGIKNVSDYDIKVVYDSIRSSGQTNGSCVSLNTSNPLVELNGTTLTVLFMGASATGNVNGTSTGYLFAKEASVIITPK